MVELTEDAGGVGEDGAEDPEVPRRQAGASDDGALVEMEGFGDAPPVEPHPEARPGLLLPDLTGAGGGGGVGGAGCDADGGGGDGDAGDGELDARGLVSEGRRRAERVRLVEDDVEAFEAKKGSFLPPDRLPMAAAAAATATARSSRAGEKSFGDRRGEGVGPRVMRRLMGRTGPEAIGSGPAHLGAGREAQHEPRDFSQALPPPLSDAGW